MSTVEYGEYQLIDSLTQRSKDGKLMLHVRCSCGKEEYKRARHLSIGRTTSCKSCASKRTAKNHPPPINRKGCGKLSGTHFNAIKNGAKRRAIAFDLTPEYLYGLYEDQNGMCAITGLPIHLDTSLKRNNVNWDKIESSLDRIDNDKGYIVGNVWWVHKEVNRLKNNYSMEDLYKWCQLILDNRDRQS